MKEWKLLLKSLVLMAVLLAACTPNEAFPVVGAEARDAEAGDENGSSLAAEDAALERAVQSVHSEQEALVFESSSGEEINYLLYLPASVDEADEWPLILYLHGSDGNGSDIELLRSRSLPVWAAPEDLSQFIVLSPQLPSGTWTNYFEQLDELLEHVNAKQPIDVDAQFVTGYSIGGTGTWQYALRALDRFAAIVPVAGGVTMSRLAPAPDEICLLKKLDIWVFQGEVDSAVIVEGNIAAIEALEDCGNTEIQFSSYAGVGHSGTWQRAYADPALYAWMLEQSRQ